MKAYQVGGQPMQQQLNSLLFDACFAKGEDISRESFLADAAVKVGLMNRERACSPFYHRPVCSDTLQAVEFLKSTEALDCVEKMVEAARANGVNGVPFIIIDGKWALNGVQPVDCYIQVSLFLSLPSPTNVPWQIFRKLAQSYGSPSIANLTKACKDCKDPITAPALSVQ